MGTILLYGVLADRFGKTHVREGVSSCLEAIPALVGTVPGFKEFVLKEKNLGYKLFSDSKVCEDVHDFVSSSTVIRLVPKIRGSKDEFGQILVGAALIAISVYAPHLAIFAKGGFLAWSVPIMGAIGFSLALGGVGRLLARNQSSMGVSREMNAVKTQYFDGPVNTSAQGECIPLILGGPILVGSRVISAGSNTETYKAGSAGGGFSGGDGLGGSTGDGTTTPKIWSLNPR